MADHLTQKDGESTWYVRMAVPADVRHAFGGRAKLIKTTGTSNRAEAMDRRLPILAQWKAQIAAARERKLVSGDQWRLAQHQAGLGIQTSRSKAVNFLLTPPDLSTPPPPPPRGRAALIQDLHRMADDLRSDGINDFADRFINHADKMLRLFEKGITPLEGLELQNDLLMITADMEAACIAEEYSLSDAEHQEAKAIVHNPAIYKPVSPITDGRLEKFRAYRVKEGIANKTIDQQESKLKKLSQHLRDQGKPLTNETVAGWLETLNLSSKTKAQYLLAGSTFWKWAMKTESHWQELHKGQDNPFKEQELPKVRGKAKVDASRKAFTREQIEGLYTVAQAQKNQKLCDLIMLGAYTGCRIEEIAQLRKESISKIEGVLSFKIGESKTAAGIREIPIHPAIQSTVARLIADSADGFLLPSSAGNQYGIRSDSLSKAFGRLKKAEGYGTQYVFHSVRSMVVTLLVRANVPGPTIANIVGHETGTVTYDVYDEGASPQQKLDALSKLSFKFN
ncbi:tyrosine-type recombinase/integrase [Pseudomonas putida]|uniref:tyrosine-type recombinase/integrase n=1 Tax=Pseudomonas putida TaxID=303 RepID=UPI0021F914CE|nr:tyrosine-type recombinase/integrase [Pseudomonas putida]